MTPSQQPTFSVDTAEFPVVLSTGDVGLTRERLRELMQWEDAYERPAADRGALDG